MSEEKAIKMGIRPLARIVSYDCQGCEPELMGMGPIYAVRNAVAKAQEAWANRSIWWNSTKPLRPRASPA